MCEERDIEVRERRARASVGKTGLVVEYDWEQLLSQGSVVVGALRSWRYEQVAESFAQRLKRGAAEAVPFVKGKGVGGRFSLRAWDGGRVPVEGVVRKARGRWRLSRGKEVAVGRWRVSGPFRGGRAQPRIRSRWFGLSALDDRRPAYDERREKPMAAAGAPRRLVHRGRVLATHHGIVVLQNNVMYHIPRGCPPHLTAMYIFWGDFSGQKCAKPASETADVVRGPLGHPSWLNRLHFGSSHSGQTASATQTPFITSPSINQVRTQEFPRLSHRQTQSRPKRLLGRLCIIKKT
ncbi:hypothetical protein B0H13DRAFT_1898553 [Mycena leptocephala]|nr:hypothetical protein B0H13DRAFT_1898553 [Mycena leptocephala]